MSKYIIIEKSKLDELRLSLLRLRDFIQDLECCMDLLIIPLVSPDPKLQNEKFLLYVLDIATDQFPPERCQEFIEATEEARRLVRETLSNE